MALLPILRYPDPLLHTVAKPVAEVNDELRQLVKNMAETMYEAPGIGLAATQVNVHKRVIVIDISEDRSGLMALINPVILERDGEQVHEEGCLSVPGIYEKVTRAERVKIRALNEKGESFEFEADDLLAVCVQHEIDHLDGKLFVDYLSRLKQDRLRKKAGKRQRDETRL
jgi:peptide deformylase